MQQNHNRQSRLFWIIPTLSSTCLTLLILGALFWAQNVGAISLGFTNATTATTTIPYQEHLTDMNGAPVSDPQTMIFSLYSQSSGGASLWSESYTGSNRVSVNDGLFNVMLGSVIAMNQSIITSHNQLYLGIAIEGNAEISPRIELGRVPYAIQAAYALDVADESITTAKLANGSITEDKLSNNFKIPVIQSGYVYASSAENAGWTLHQGTGERQYVHTVRFDKRFEQTPHVITSITQVAAYNDTHLRADVYVGNITQDSFDIIFNTWDDSRIDAMMVTWVAHTAP